MNDDKKYSYELHLVSYNDTCLKLIPYRHEKLIIEDTQVCLNEITSVHDFETELEAVNFFNETVENILSSGQSGEFHIKLEYMKDLVSLNSDSINEDNISKHYPNLPISISYDQNFFIGGFGWDIHIDGVFNEKIKNFLIKNNWVFLNYKADDNKGKLTTLTQHFLSKEECEDTFDRITGYLKKVGGFSGNIYWEEPVKYYISTR
ncbi:MAG: hypothetical protein WD048_13095 [Chitinophagales bacterium]